MRCTLSIKVLFSLGDEVGLMRNKSLIILGGRVKQEFYGVENKL